MKTAVVYYSLEGNVRYVAEKIAGATGADLIELVTVKAYPDKGFKKFFWGGKAATMKDKPELEPYSFKAEDYELVVLCSPVWVGTCTPPFRTFLSENDLTGRKVAVVASSAGGNGEKCFRELQEMAHVDALVAELSLVDPKAKPSEDKEQKIAAFIEQLK